MNKKIRINGLLSLIFMTLSFFMMQNTKYSKALGDYILEFIGLKSWTDGDTGTHLTVIYFGVLFLIGLYFVTVNVVVGWNKRRRVVLLYSVVLLLIYNFFISSIFVLIKSNSDGLLSIGFENTNDSYLEYTSIDKNKIDYFKIKFELKNYSSEEKSFSIQLVNTYLEEYNSGLLIIYKKNGNIAVFSLLPNEAKEFVITTSDYYLEEGINSDVNVNSFRGSIDRIILSDQQGNEIYLDNREFFGITVK
jgi:hypothetical protein